MKRYKETFKTWNKVATLYEDKFMDFDLYNDTYDLFCEAIKKNNPTILEIGCGPGNITKYLLSKRPDFNIQGIDIAPNMIKLAKKNNPTANFKVLDSRRIETLETKFDGIICGFCLPYLSEKDSMKLIKDCKQFLSEKGILYISFVDGNYEKSGYQIGTSGDKMYFYYHELEKLETELIQNEFQLFHKINKLYKKASETEVHTILIAERNK